MKLLLGMIALIACGSQTLAQDGNTRTSPQHQRYAMLCFSKGEQISGMNKICYYDCLGSAAAITVSSVQLCPLTIER